MEKNPVELKPKSDPNKDQDGENPEIRHDISAEAQSYLRGLFGELQLQAQKYLELTRALLNLEARVELAEKTVSLTRDHLVLAIDRSDSMLPNDWKKVFNEFRFVGVRVAEGCMTLLKENKKMTPTELLIGLNKGMFRFRTSSPLREIHAALLRQNFAKKEDQHWVWIGPDDSQTDPDGNGEGEPE